MDSEELGWFLNAIFGHLVVLIGVIIAIHLCLKEYYVYKRATVQSQIMMPRVRIDTTAQDMIVLPKSKLVRYSSLCVMGGSTLVMLGCSMVAIPYVCDHLQVSKLTEFVYVLIRLFLYLFQIHRLRSVFGPNQANLPELNYKEWVFFVFQCYLVFLLVCAIFMSLVWKEQKAYSTENNEYYYKGCYDIHGPQYFALVGLYAALFFIADWTVLALYFIKIRKLTAMVRTVNDTVNVRQTKKTEHAKKLNNSLRKIFGLSLTMELLSIISVIINLIWKEELFLSNVCVVVDSLWNIMATRLILQHNSVEFEDFTDTLGKYFGKYGLRFCCLWLDKETGDSVSVASASPDVASAPADNDASKTGTNDINKHPSINTSTLLPRDDVLVEHRIGKGDITVGPARDHPHPSINTSTLLTRDAILVEHGIEKGDISVGPVRDDPHPDPSINISSFKSGDIDSILHGKANIDGTAIDPPNNEAANQAHVGDN